MAETVVEHELGVRWEPNAPEAVVLAEDTRVAVSVRPHPEDDDPRVVVLLWSGVVRMSTGAPNDEALHLHRLSDRGLDRVMWLGRVEQSELVDTVAVMRHEASDLSHWVVPLKECLTEVVGRSVEVLRIAGTTRSAAVAALS